MDITSTQWSDSLSDKTRGILLQLIYAKAEDAEKREKLLDYLESTSEYDAEEIIKSLSTKPY